MSLSLFLLWITSVNNDGITVDRWVDKQAGLEAVIITIPANQNHSFGMIDVPNKSPGDDILSYWRPGRHSLMINGGYFEDDFSPTGLCRIDGKVINPSNDPKLSGFLAIDGQGKLVLLTKHDQRDAFPTVLQSGPYVIDPGGKIGIHSRSGAPARRTLVGVTTEGDIVIIVTEPIHLFDLAVLVSNRLPQIERLLNLDGGPSTALAVEGQVVRNRWPVRNYVFKVD